jgi:hypothetical protein
MQKAVGVPRVGVIMGEEVRSGIDQGDDEAFSDRRAVSPATLPTHSERLSRNSGSEVARERRK